MSELLTDPLADLAARDLALDINRSVIVQAPAGSGKTDLLTRRYLRLLAAVDKPEEILAITFTRAATAEMRSRILGDLEAATGRGRWESDDPERMAGARAALANAEQHGWNLFDHPQRLAVETIDSLCLRIAHDRPLLARLGGHFQPIEEAEPLYALAARRTLERLGGSDPVLDRALAQLLDLRDNRLSDCQSLIAKMLETRDQWVHAFPLSGQINEEEWDRLRMQLEVPFRREIGRVVSEAHRLLTGHPAIEQQLIDLAQHACSHGNEHIALLGGVTTLSTSMPVEHWQCLCDFLLTGKQFRKKVDIRQGFPATTREARQRKEAMHDLLYRLEHVPELLPTLLCIRDLPPATYTEAQWTTLRNIFIVLRQATADLRVVFAEKNQVDFSELSLAATLVLKETPERVLDVTGNVRHLLIDEFQDTSRRQHDLVSALLLAWEPGEGRTIFLVGDPMQSIYMFRQAEVELFTEVREQGIGPEHNRLHCTPVQLWVNFRSHTGLTEPLNRVFELICAVEAPRGAASVPFVRATSTKPAPSEQPWLHIHPQIIGTADQRPALAEQEGAQRREALEVFDVIQRHLPAIEEARAAGDEYRVAILVRARPHLDHIVPLLRERNIPFRAVEIEPLGERQELLDLRALTRALLHPMDRVAWLSVLRAPWCGLTLSDLHRLTGADNLEFKNLTILELVDRHRNLLSAEGQRRLARTMEILRRALDMRWRQSESPSFSSWIERTWQTLGGPLCLDAAALENTQVFLSLLDNVAPDGLAALSGSFDAEFDRLFAQPDPTVSERCGIQVMTIHKAKGLGFDVVLVPGLERGSSGDANPLVCSLERANPFSGEPEFLVAPIGLQGEDSEPLYKWVRKQRQIRFDEERKRLLYVACTRARRELHLFGTAVARPTGIGLQNNDSLLATAWPALQTEFESVQRTSAVAVPASVVPFPIPGVLEEVAATTEPATRLTLRRLALDSEPAMPAVNVTVADAFSLSDPGTPGFVRPEGSRQARLVGSVIHTLLERLGPGLAGIDVDLLRARAAALLRAAALTGDVLRSATEAVTRTLLGCAKDPVCQWILAPHIEAQSEASWTGFLPGESRIRTLRADRVFRAGSEPLGQGSDFFWVIDYKTTGRGLSGALFLAEERAVYAPQLQAYARALRAMHGVSTPLRLGLYYPAIAALDFWDPDKE